MANAILQGTVKKAPHDRLLIETGATGLGQEGHPSELPDLLQIANVVAHLRGVYLAQLEVQTNDSLERLIGSIN